MATILSEFDYDNIPDLASVPEGEYELQIIEARDYVGKTSGKASVQVIFVIEGHPDADTLYHYLALPAPEDDERKKHSKLRRIKEFFSAFGLSSQDEYEEWVGKKSWALLTQEADNNGSMRNSVRKFIIS